MTLPYLGLGAYLVISIFYVLPSGQPQPADLLLMLTVTFSVVHWWKLPRLPDLYAVLTLFCLWIVAVNTYFFAIYGSYDFLLKSVYYAFNAFVFVFVVMAGCRDWEALRTVVRWACVIALSAQFAYLMLVGATTTSGVRSVGTFNNPNQLGYWALLAMASLAVAKDRQPLNAIDLAALTAGGYALLLSLSKAAIISGVVLIIMILAFRRVNRDLAIVATVSIVGAVAISQLGSIDDTSWATMDALEHRFSSKSADDDIMVRGYQVILDHPEHWLFGAGEGNYPRRFAGGIVKLEIHSTIGSLFFSYGMIGLGLFGVVLWAAFHRAPWASQAYFIPIMMYGVTHNGIRFSELWIFLALVYAQRRHRRCYHALDNMGNSPRPGATIGTGSNDNSDWQPRIPNRRDGGRRPVPCRLDFPRPG